MDRHISVSFFETVVLANVVQVITTNDNGALHLHLSNFTTKDTTTNFDGTNEGAFLVHILAFFSFTRCLETKTDLFNVSKRAT